MVERWNLTSKRNGRLHRSEERLSPSDISWSAPVPGSNNILDHSVNAIRPCSIADGIPGVKIQTCIKCTPPYYRNAHIITTTLFRSCWFFASISALKIPVDHQKDCLSLKVAVIDSVSVRYTALWQTQN